MKANKIKIDKLIFYIKNKFLIMIMSFYLNFLHFSHFFTFFIFNF
jgi:hypothetical protein